MLILRPRIVELLDQRQRQAKVLACPAELAAQGAVERIGLQGALEIFLGLFVIALLQEQFAEGFQRVGVIGKTLEQVQADLFRLGELLILAVEVEQRDIGVEPIRGELDRLFVALLGVRLEGGGLVGEHVEERVHRFAAPFSRRAGVLGHACPDDGLGALADFTGPKLR